MTRSVILNLIQDPYISNRFRIKSGMTIWRHMPKLTSKEEFEKIVEEKDTIIFVDMFAEWCGPCQMMSPVIEEIEEENKDKNIKILTVDIDKLPEVAAKYSVMSVPTFLFIKNGEVAESIVGAVTKDIILDKIKALSEKD